MPPPYSSDRVKPDRSKNQVFSSPVLRDTTLSLWELMSVNLNIARLSGSSATIPEPAEGASPTLVVVASLSGVNFKPINQPAPQSVTICPDVCLWSVPVIFPALTVIPVCISAAVVPQKSVSAAAPATVTPVINLHYPLRMLRHSLREPCR